MFKTTPPIETMSTLVRLRRGRTPRRTSITLTVSKPSWDPADASRVFAVFTRAVDAGLFGSKGGSVRTETLGITQAEHTVSTRWEALFPKLRSEAFGVLSRMMAASVPGARALEVREHGPETALVVHSLAPEIEATLPDLPWTLRFTRASAPAVKIWLREPPSVQTLRQAEDILEAWADLIAMGGYPRSDSGTSAARRARLRSPREGELHLELDYLSCSYDAYEALFEGLCRLGESAPLALVEVGAPDQHGFESIAAPGTGAGVRAPAAAL